MIFICVKTTGGFNKQLLGGGEGVRGSSKVRKGQQVKMEEKKAAGLRRSVDSWQDKCHAGPNTGLSRTWTSKDFPNHTKHVGLLTDIHGDCKVIPPSRAKTTAVTQGRLGAPSRGNDNGGGK